MKLPHFAKGGSVESTAELIRQLQAIPTFGVKLGVKPTPHETRISGTRQPKNKIINR